MSIRNITTDDLRRMNGQEALILQGCGGSLQEWVDGINDMLAEDGILLEGTKFHDCSTFEHDGVTCLVFPFSDDVKLNVGRLAMWKLATHNCFAGTWLSDYVPNRLGGFIDVTTEDFASMMVCAVRYALGRESYMPSVVIGFITPLIPALSDRAIGCLERDVRDPMTYGCGSYGDEKIDKPGWMRFLAALEEERKKRGLRPW